MSDPFIGEIRMFVFRYAPENWADCDGSIMNIAEYTSLFALLGTTYGGDGVNTFALPDLRGRVPVHVGQGAGMPHFYQGWAGGRPMVTLTGDQIPSHTHPLMGKDTAANNAGPSGHTLANTGRSSIYIDQEPDTPLHHDSIGPSAGGGQAHDNMQPYLAVRFCIALDGIWPPRP